MRVRAAAAAAALAVLVTLAVVLSQDSSRLLATNFTTIQLDAGVIVRAGAESCQPREVIPAGSAEVRMYMSTAGKPGGPVVVSVRDGGRTVSQGSSPGGYVDEQIGMRIEPVDRRLAGAAVCIRNRGERDFAVLGTRAQRRRAARLTSGGNPNHSIAWLGWFRAHSPSRFSRLGDFAERAGLVKASFFGTWTFWAGAALLLVVGVAAALVAVREGRRP